MEARRLGRADVGLARKIVSELKGCAPSPALADWLADESHILLAALDSGSPVGFALGYLVPRPDGSRPMLLLYELEVRASHRRRGIGRRLVEARKEIASESGASKTWVVADAANEAACALYEATGGIRSPAAALFTWRKPPKENE